MNVESYGISDVGMRREKNEDSYLLDDDIALYMIADGMGGHVGGGFASQLAVKTISEVLKESFTKGSKILQENSIRSNDIAAQLRFAIEKASQNIFSAAKNDKSLNGMGTTTVLMTIKNGRVYVGNVGDSRAYLIRGDRIIQLTQDHSLVGEQLRAGMLSERMAKGHKLKNIITRSVGFQEEVDIDIMVKIPRERDKYLLCSDGLTNMVSDEEILEIVKDNNIKEACHLLIDLANERGGDDNITVIISYVSDVGEGSRVDEESTIGI